MKYVHPWPLGAIEIVQHPAQVLEGRLVIVPRDVLSAKPEGSERSDSLINSLTDNALENAL